MVSLWKDGSLPLQYHHTNRSKPVTAAQEEKKKPPTLMFAWDIASIDVIGWRASI